MSDEKLSMEEMGYPELLEDLAATVADLLHKKLPLMNRDAAAQIGIDTAEHLRAHWGGISLYIPQGSVYAASQKHLAIWQDFTGHNHKQVAKKHHVSVQHVYVVVRRMKSKLRDKHQPQLF